MQETSNLRLIDKENEEDGFFVKISKFLENIIYIVFILLSILKS